MKKKKIVALMVACMMLLFVTACSTNQNNTDGQNSSGEAVGLADEVKNPEDALKDEVETAIVEFEYACQTLDVDAMIDCLDPGVAQALKSGRLLLNWMSSESDSDEMIMDTMLISLMNIADITVDFSTMRIEITEINALDEIATVNANLSMSCSTGTYEDEIAIRMSKDTSSNTWYITGVTA